MAKTIKEIEEILFSNNQLASSEELKNLENDQRKGVQNLIKRWKAKIERERLAKEKFLHMSRYEMELRENGISFIAGVDEVGRGPLAGPVVAASVILPEDFYLAGLNDSKAVSESNRDFFYEEITKNAVSFGIGIVTPEEIDKINIYEATKVAMTKAINDMNNEAEHLLIDAMTLPVQTPQTSIIKGDANSVSIAASSIIAKVTRDRIMEEIHEKYPQYGFKNNMGYGTKEHLDALKTYGVTSVHRKSFAPVRNQLMT
ncbi:ribonuclease HII [Lottiidibacillus patelloidae]|uniref:Ribonuclease HII n=1 Tax=Lottiidibacillus patelloidae TaxID=2670334 RepID=A0A263BXX3_9BACI|nr:ribonuclease HII [Lottiidibacillus patelloidae]OZM58583.1 ribonuclease HII [Lottiidibacillus patelloidae]